MFILIITAVVQICILYTAYTNAYQICLGKKHLLSNTPSRCTPPYSCLPITFPQQTTGCLVSPECAQMQQRQLTPLRSFHVFPSGSEERCVLEMQATIKEKCTGMLLFGPSLTEIVEVVEKMKQIR